MPRARARAAAAPCVRGAPAPGIRRRPAGEATEAAVRLRATEEARETGAAMTTRALERAPTTTASTQATGQAFRRDSQKAWWARQPPTSGPPTSGRPTPTSTAAAAASPQGRVVARTSRTATGRATGRVRVAPRAATGTASGMARRARARATTTRGRIRTPTDTAPRLGGPATRARASTGPIKGECTTVRRSRAERGIRLGIGSSTVCSQR
mmetsp:Transcript_46649/g.124684  ORF Transcript_46649/g.124684 Transcript_46649/m.124684 type:complete len:211 (+) Transcript_46649:156-788(+)